MAQLRLREVPEHVLYDMFWKRNVPDRRGTIHNPQHSYSRTPLPSWRKPQFDIEIRQHTKGGFLRLIVNGKRVAFIRMVGTHYYIDHAGKQYVFPDTDKIHVWAKKTFPELGKIPEPVTARRL